MTKIKFHQPKNILKKFNEDNPFHYGVVYSREDVTKIIEMTQKISAMDVAAWLLKMANDEGK